MSKMSQDPVYQVRMARWEGWRRLAKELPDRHILAVELLRTRNDGTAAVFTVVKQGEPVQFIVRADARGRLRPGDRQDVGDRTDDCGPDEPRASMAMAARAADETMDANSIAMGEPPPKEPPPPGIFGLATVLLASAFDLGEQIPTGTEPA